MLNDSNISPTDDKPEDFTGRDLILSNVIYSWTAEVLVIIAGFILPRMIDRNIGQTSLGIWDLSWSVVNYFGFAMLGIGSSINRYVALYRSQNDIDSLKKSVSSVLALQIGVAFLVLILTFFAVLLAPAILSGSKDYDIVSTRWVISCLGTSLALQFGCDISKGVITGCHKWGLFNGIKASFHLINLFFMIIALEFGGGLKSIGITYLIVTFFCEIFKLFAAFRVCPELSIKPKYINLQHAKRMLVFGGKTFITGIPSIVISQTISIIIANALGPATLAVFSRPMALIRNFRTFMSEYTFIFTPTAGSLIGSGKSHELKQLYIDSSRYSFAIAFPVVLFLIIYGDFLLEIWMGREYANGTVLTIIAIGFFFPISQNAALRILIGMDSHGKIGVLSTIISLIIFVFGVIAIYMVGPTVINCALVLSLSIAVGNGFIVPICACAKLKISFMEFFKFIVLSPAICNVPFVLTLVAFKYFIHNIYSSTLISLFLGGIIIGSTYFKFLIPDEFRFKILNFINKNMFGK